MGDGKASMSRLGRGGRMTARRKRNAVIRLLGGEDLELVPGDLGGIAATPIHVAWDLPECWRGGSQGSPS